MKKNWFYLFFLLAFAAMPLVSCSNDDEPDTGEGKHDPTLDDDRTEMTSYDALDWLQSCLVVVGDNNEVIRRIYGKPLDESQPTVISVPVDDLAEAEEIFLGWVAPDKEVTTVDGGYDYNLTDAEGNAQGSVSFRAVEGEVGVMARMSVANGTDLKMVSEVKFIDADMWPENARGTLYRTGEVYWIDDYFLTWTYNGTFLFQPSYTLNTPEKSPLLFYCLRGHDKSGEAILVWLSPDDEDSCHHPEPVGYYSSSGYNAYHYLSPVSAAKKLVEFYDHNQDEWDYMLEVMDSYGLKWSPQGGDATGHQEFILNYLMYSKFAVLDLDEDLFGENKGEIDYASIGSVHEYRYIHILIVPHPKL